MQNILWISGNISINILITHIMEITNYNMKLKL